MRDRRGTKYLDDRMMETPSIAIEQVIKETLNMANLVMDSYNTSMEAFLKKVRNSQMKLLEWKKL
ncbi:hypothetical protein [Marinisporobacter balticus]|uniref:Uncharacterized protein n=1 Tax=Marinisporobacter balticus TaxID=2018667 RepID=A0A4R2L2N1_9FIRM|nr:hypothetical protein [Marinisporobacter balticus]TCO79477.1 hypothetical protein EV214_102199 [Marinisporobacter balticus]